MADSYIQLLTPTSADSPVAKYLDNKGEGIHHVATGWPTAPPPSQPVRPPGAGLSTRRPDPGLRGTTVAFVHPRAPSAPSSSWSRQTNRPLGMEAVRGLGRTQLPPSEDLPAFPATAVGRRWPAPEAPGFRSSVPGDRGKLGHALAASPDVSAAPSGRTRTPTPRPPQGLRPPCRPSRPCPADAHPAPWPHGCRRSTPVVSFPPGVAASSGPTSTSSSTPGRAGRSTVGKGRATGASADVEARSAPLQGCRTGARARACALPVVGPGA